MSTQVVHEKNEMEATFSQKLNDFLVKYRTVFVVIVGVLVVAFAVLIIVTNVSERKSRVAYEKIETLVKDWEAAKAAPEQTGLTAKEDDILAQLLAVGKAGKSSFAGARAFMSAGEIYFSRKDWKNAQEQYLAAAKADARAYTAGNCLYNAAVCADEQGNSDEAVALFNRAIALESFPLKPRAYFNIGRIEEQRAHAEAAIAAYEKMAEQFPDDEWTMLAKSRIIALKIK